MISLPKDLVSRCRQVLLECDKFDSAETLKTIFDVEELAPFQHALPHANSREDRVDKTIRFLLHKKLKKGHPIFLPFLETLCIYIPQEDSLHRELEQLSIDIEYAYFSEFLLTKHTNNGYSPISLWGNDNFSDNVLEAVQYFLNLNHMRDKHLVKEVLGLLPTKIAQDISIDGHMFGFKDILHIVQICFRYPDGLEKLAYAFYQKEGDSPHWQILDAFICRIGKKTVTYTRLQQLQIILMGITWLDKILSKAYKASIPNDWIESTGSSITHLPSILETLAVAPLQSDGTFPIIVFAQYLAHYAQKYQEVSIHNALILWIKERTQELGLSASQVSILHDKVGTDCIPAAYYLLITLDPESESSFCMQAWLLDSEGNTISNAGIEVEQESVSFEQVPIVLDFLLEKCGDYLVSEINKLIIEFVLPSELLCYPIDHWLIDTGMETVKLGIQHKVVVRSLERLRSRRMRPLWESKWKELQKLLDGGSTLTDNQSSVWICNEDQYGTYESLYAALRKSPVVCLALAFAPLDDFTSLSHMLKATIGVGIPIALWPRKLTNNPTTAYNLFSSFLSPKTLFKIPHLVWEQRLAAGESRNEHHQGHHLTLLWDDPNRLPPTVNAVKFGMPSTRRGA